MLTNNLKPDNVQITSNLKVAFKFARQKYQLALEAVRSKNEKQAVEDQKAIILSKIEDVKSQITLLTKTSVMLEKLAYIDFESLCYVDAFTLFC